MLAEIFIELSDEQLVCFHGRETDQRTGKFAKPFDKKVWTKCRRGRLGRKLGLVTLNQAATTSRNLGTGRRNTAGSVTAQWSDIVHDAGVLVTIEWVERLCGDDRMHYDTASRFLAVQRGEMTRTCHGKGLIGDPWNA